MTSIAPTYSPLAHVLSARAFAATAAEQLSSTPDGAVNVIDPAIPAAANAAEGVRHIDLAFDAADGTLNRQVGSLLANARQSLSTGVSLLRREPIDPTGSEQPPVALFNSAATWLDTASLLLKVKEGFVQLPTPDSPIQ